MSTTGFGTSPAPAEDQKQRIQAARLALTARARSGANWFLWIAGLSIINSVLMRTGSHTQFIVGLGTNQVADGVGQMMAKQGNAAAGAVFSAIVSVFMVAIFVLFGIFARKGAKWAFYVGMTVYALDALLFVLAKDVLGLGFHALVLYFLYRGLAANGQLEKLKAALAAPVINTGPPPIG